MLMKVDQKLVDAAHSVAERVTCLTGVGRLQQARAAYAACALVVPIGALAGAVSASAAQAGLFLLALACILQIVLCTRMIAREDEEPEGGGDGAIDPVRYGLAFIRLAFVVVAVVGACYLIAGAYGPDETPRRTAEDIQWWLFAIGSYLMANGSPGARSRREQRAAGRSTPAVAVEHG